MASAAEENTPPYPDFVHAAMRYIEAGAGDWKAVAEGIRFEGFSPEEVVKLLWTRGKDRGSDPAQDVAYLVLVGLMRGTNVTKIKMDLRGRPNESARRLIRLLDLYQVVSEKPGRGVLTLGRILSSFPTLSWRLLHHVMDFPPLEPQSCPAQLQFAGAASLIPHSMRDLFHLYAKWSVGKSLQFSGGKAKKDDLVRTLNVLLNQWGSADHHENDRRNEIASIMVVQYALPHEDKIYLNEIMPGFTDLIPTPIPKESRKLSAIDKSLAEAVRLPQTVARPAKTLGELAAMHGYRASDFDPLPTADKIFQTIRGWNRQGQKNALDQLAAADGAEALAEVTAQIVLPPKH